MTSPFHPAGTQFAWDSTSLGWAQDCLRKYQYLMIEGWEPMSKSVHLLFGGWYATALEHYHKHRANGMNEDDALCEVVHEALVATWVYDDCPACKGTGQLDITEEAAPKMKWAGRVDYVRQDCDNCNATGKLETGHPWDGNHSAKTRENLIRSIVWYVDQFGDDDPLTTVILANGEAAVEYSFRMELSDDIIYCGHIDRLVEYNGDVYVQDQKTTGSTITPRFFAQFDPNSQMSGYTLAGQIIYSAPVRGVIIDAAQIAVGFTRFERGFTFRSEAKLEEWLEAAQYHIRAAQEATRRGVFPMNPSSCDKYGGCMFRDICSKSPEVRPQFLKGNFTKRKQWNPLESR